MVNLIIIFIILVIIVTVLLLFTVKCSSGEVIICKSNLGLGRVRVKNKRALVIPGLTSSIVADISPISNKFETDFMCDGGLTRINKAIVFYSFVFNQKDLFNCNELRYDRDYLEVFLNNIVRSSILRRSRSYSVEDIADDPSKISNEIKRDINEACSSLNIKLFQFDIDFTSCHHQIRTILGMKNIK